MAIILFFQFNFPPKVTLFVPGKDEKKKLCNKDQDLYIQIVCISIKEVSRISPATS